MSGEGPVPGVPFTLHAHYSSEFRRRFKIVRADALTDVEGEIIAAAEETGECTLEIAGETNTLNFGPGGMRIVARGRR